MTALSNRALAFVACWVANIAHAQPQLEWSAPSACPSRAAVESAIDRALDPAVRAHSTLRIEAEVEPLGGAYALQLTVQTASGESRERLVASDCALFARLIAVKVSLLATAQPPEAAAAPPSASSDARESRDSAPEVPAWSGRASSDASEADLSAPEWSVRAQAGVATSPTPAAAFAAAVGGGFRVRLFRIELAATYVFPRDRFFPGQSDAGAAFQAWSASLRPCLISPWPGPASPLGLAGCAGIEAGLVRGSGFGVEPAKVSERPFVTVSAGLSPTFALAQMLVLRADVEVLINGVRPDFYVRNLGVLHRVPGFGARALIGVELRLP